MRYWLYGKHGVLAALRNKNRIVHEIIITKENIGLLSDLDISISDERLSIVNSNKEISDLIKKRNSKNGFIRENRGRNSFFNSNRSNNANRSDNSNEIHHQGIAIWTEKLIQPKIEDFIKIRQNESDSYQSIIILDGLTDPNNIGGIFRIAAAFGLEAIISTENNSPDENASIVKVGCGTFEKIPFIKVVNLQNTINLLKKHGYWILGLSAKVVENKMHTGAIDYQKLAFIIGSEDKGLRKNVSENCDILMKIPTMIESLNVVTAMAIAGYQRMRDIEIMKNKK